MTEQGGYAGLSLVMVWYADDVVQAGTGFIIASDWLPSTPDAIEPPDK